MCSYPQLFAVISDLSGVTNLTIIRVIVPGQRDGRKLAEFRDPNIKASKETIALSLDGTWLPEQLAIVERHSAMKIISKNKLRPAIKT